MDASEYHLSSGDGDGEEWTREVSEKKTLTDDQWIIVKKIRTRMPEAKLEYQHEYYSNGDEETTGIDYVCVTVPGVYDLAVDVMM